MKKDKHNAQMQNKKLISSQTTSEILKKSMTLTWLGIEL
jgi:hypothetical protein